MRSKTGPVRDEKISELMEGYLEYARYDLGLSLQTVTKYRDCLRSFLRDIGDKKVKNLNVQDFLRLKRIMMERGLSESRIAGVVYAMKSFLSYGRNFLNIPVMDLELIRPPKLTTKEVVFLTKDEIDRFINTIDTEMWHGLRFRVLVEVLLGTGMRISEALSLDRKDIDWEKKEAKVLGKGRKERRIFFTDRSLYWLRRFIECRRDNHDAIFVTQDRSGRLKRDDIWRSFDKHRRMAKINKKLTPHILRHTVATNLVFSGCPIVHVKEILGHERLHTTFKYYLGVDKELAKQAHRQHSTFMD